MITELWAIIVVAGDGEDEGIAQYPMSDKVMIALDMEQRDRLVADAKSCASVWQRSLRLARFEIKDKEAL